MIPTNKILSFSLLLCQGVVFGCTWIQELSPLILCFRSALGGIKSFVARYYTISTWEIRSVVTLSCRLYSLGGFYCWKWLVHCNDISIVSCSKLNFYEITWWFYSNNWKNNITQLAEYLTCLGGFLWKNRALRLSLRILAILADEPTFVQIYGYQHSLRISILMSPGGALD